jgi:5-methylcytosine-specific restriction endonuclease McrA
MARVGKAALRSYLQVASGTERAQKRGRRATLTVEEWQRIKVAFMNRCAYCLADGALTLDHVVPMARGGHHTFDNVVPACSGCNAGKHAHDVADWLESIGENWDEVLGRIAVIRDAATMDGAA